MNILWVSNATDKFMFKTSRLELTKGLRKRGNQVLLIMAKKIGEKKSNNSEVIYLPTAPYPIISGILLSTILFFYVPYIIKKKKIDVVIAGGISIWFPFATILKASNIPIIMDIRGLPIDKKNSMSFDIFLKLSKYSLDGLTTITPELKEIIIQRYNFKENKIGIWSSGVSMKNFSKPSVVKDNIKAVKDSKSFIVIYHGSYSPTRGVENLLEALGELDGSINMNIKLLIVGFSQDEISKLSKFCEEIGVRDQVKFISKVPYEEIASYISIADVGVIPLPPENKWWQVSSPLKTLEYLAMGKPIIVTNIPFHQRIFDKGECGVLLDSASPKAFAQAITYLYHNKEKLDKMGKKGKEIVEKYHTWDRKALEIEKFLQSILASL